jgi:pyruvate/2-oxoglutarate dehydrogenase complex dihydrolipoamide acyltransferase (E2) component
LLGGLLGGGGQGGGQQEGGGQLDPQQLQQLQGLVQQGQVDPQQLQGLLQQGQLDPEQLQGLLGQGGGDGEAGQNGSGLPGAGDLPGADTGSVAKVVVKTVAHEIGSAASDEMKEIGTAAARKAREIGERRRQRRAEKYNATPAALKAAEEAGLDIEEIEGTGSDARITVKDVREAVEA